MQRSRRAYESEPYFAHVAVEDEDEPAAEEGEEPVEPETEFVDVTAEGDYVHLGQSECEHQEQSLWQVAQSSTLAASANVANAAANFVRDVSHAGIGAAARATATAAASSMRAVSETAHIPSLEEMQASIADLRESVLTRAGARRRKTKQKPRRRFGDPLKPPPSPGSSPIAMVGQGTVELPRAWNAAASQLARPVADWGTSGHDMESRYRMKFGAVEETYFGESETDSQASADFHDPVPVVEGELDAELDEELEEIQERQYRQMLMIEEAERSLDRKGKGRADS